MPLLDRPTLHLKAWFHRLSVGQKIGFGYAVALSVAIGGTASGVVIGQYYEYQARLQLNDAAEEQRLVKQLQKSILDIREHQRYLTSEVLPPLELQDEYRETIAIAEAMHQTWLALKASYQEVAEIMDQPDERSTFHQLVKRYDGITQIYRLTLEQLFQPDELQRLLEENPRGTLARFQQLEQSTASQTLHNFAEELDQLLDNANYEIETANQVVRQAEHLQMQIIAISMLLSIALASLLAYMTSRAIVRPIRAATFVAQIVKQDDNFDLQIPVTTQDEVSILTTALNDLIQRVKQLLIEQKIAEAQLVHSEKMSSLGQLVAGIAHEINNPVSFIHGNLSHTQTYVQDLMGLLHLYQQHYPTAPIAIQQESEAIDLDFVEADLPKLLQSMQVGTKRIQDIVLSLRCFSRLDEADFKTVDIHDGIESALLILQHRLTIDGIQTITITKDYSDLPLVECYPGQLNQVFMNVIANAIDAIYEKHQRASGSAILDRPVPPAQPVLTNPFGHPTDDDDLPTSIQTPTLQRLDRTEQPTIHIRTQRLFNDHIAICITDNGCGMTESTRSRLFDPFFTTKPVGQGAGLGLSVSYQIVTKQHSGQLSCHSVLNQGTEFVIEIPIQQEVTPVS